jgi:hypothetical protein
VRLVPERAPSWRRAPLKAVRRAMPECRAFRVWHRWPNWRPVARFPRSAEQMAAERHRVNPMGHPPERPVSRQLSSRQPESYWLSSHWLSRGLERPGPRLSCPPPRRGLAQAGETARDPCVRKVVLGPRDPAHACRPTPERARRRSGTAVRTGRSFQRACEPSINEAGPSINEAGPSINEAGATRKPGATGAHPIAGQVNTPTRRVRRFPSLVSCPGSRLPATSRADTGSRPRFHRCRGSLPRRCWWSSRPPPAPSADRPRCPRA